MNHDNNSNVLPSLTRDLLTQPGAQVDNLFNRAWQQLSMNTVLEQCAIRKRSGTPANEVVY